MASVFDVAESILRERGPMSAMKLQKLVYYSQAWSLAWDEAPLFEEDIEAWANGPVVRGLFEVHRGQFRVVPEMFLGNPDALTEKEHDVVRRVVAFYGDKSPQWLSDLTHSEDPWKNARVGVPDGASSNAVIGKDAMLEYYSSL